MLRNSILDFFPLIRHPDIESHMLASDFRILTGSLFIYEFGAVTYDQLCLLYLMNNSTLSSKSTLRRIVTRDLSSGCIKKETLKGVKIFTLTSSGVKNMFRALVKVHEQLKMSIPNDLFSTWQRVAECPEKNELSGGLRSEFEYYQYTKLKRFSLNAHSLAISSHSMFALFHLSFPVKKTIRYGRECSILLDDDLHLPTKAKNTSVADFVLSFDRLCGPAAAFEVDLNTERPGGKLIDKIRAYDASYHAPDYVDLFFLFDNSDSFQIIDTSVSLEDPMWRRELHELVTKRKVRRTDIDYIRMLYRIYEQLRPNENSFFGFVGFVHSYITDSLHKEGWYLLLEYIQRYWDGLQFNETVLKPSERRDMQICHLEAGLSCIKIVADEKSLSINTRSGVYLLRKKSSLSRYVESMVQDCVQRNCASGILSGMKLCLTVKDRVWERFGFVYPLTYFKGRIRKFISNIGLPIKAEDELTILGRGYDMPASPMLSFRSAIRFGKYVVAFENISEDLGGLLRIRHYLFSQRFIMPNENLIVIALIDNQLSLASGESFPWTYMFDPWGSRPQVSNSLYSYIEYRLSLCELSDERSRTIKWACDHEGRVLGFLTYRHFLSAFQEPTSLWYKSSGIDKTYYYEFIDNTAEGKTNDWFF